MLSANVTMTVPKDTSKPVWLLTIMGQFVFGYWEGRIGEHYIGWTNEEPVQTS
jgi:hypothetical protein